MADDLEYPINFEEEVINKKFFTPLQNAKELNYLKDECLSCPMFDICNGCYKHVKDLKRSQKVEEHCTKMKSIAKDILEINFKENRENRMEVHTTKDETKISLKELKGKE
jgi:sulfatase maturation enzyme AslB (radical SAM superfamily)